MKIVVEGGHRLSGRVRVDGAKNAVLPILAASLLAEEPVTLHGVPALDDVLTMGGVLQGIGVDLESEPGGTIHVNPGASRLQPAAPDDLVRRMRASFLILGPLLARMGEARIALPGGCAIGSRPIDLHLKGLEALGAELEHQHGCIRMRARRLMGARIYLDFPSVGATENILMVAVLASGTTFIENAAEEPEVVDLANFLIALGARVYGAGSKIIRVDGVRRLKGASYTVIPDRIEAGTFLTAAAITGGDVWVTNALPEHLKPTIAKLREAGCEVWEEEAGGVRARAKGRPRAIDIKTLPYPGFPTDMQAQMMALCTLADGTSIITETVFENRFMHVDELKRMGARIQIQGHSAVVKGVPSLCSASVTATDLRAGAALVLAGLAAEGRTEVGGLHHLDRGYVDLEGKLRDLGANIQRRDEWPAPSAVPDLAGSPH
ncbi:MAG: UDP-N-acetylglucosamine 1-carboxyvinyltransferase [Bacillota bacterium]